MVRFNWLLAALACAILGATLLASCDSEGVIAPDPTCQDPASCPYSLNSSKDIVSSTDTEQEGSQPDIEQPAPPPAPDYTGEPCPNIGCVLTKAPPDEPNEWDCGEPPDFPPDSMIITGIPTAWVPAKCGIPEPTNE